MFIHKHPYKPFLNEETTKLIIGTLPPPRFTIGQLLEKDVDFCYGSCHNSLWLYIDEIHNLNLRYDNSQEAIDQRKQFLIDQRIGVCDIVESAEREKIDASDLGMKNIILRDILSYLNIFNNVNTLLFIGGNSKNGPEYFFRKHIRDYKIKLEVVSGQVPRIHQFLLNERMIQTVSLTSSSGAANLSIGSNADYKRMKAENPDFNTFDFRVMQYRNYF